MAYVKKSEAVFDEIVRRIEVMFKSQFNYAESWSEYGLTVEEIENKIWRNIMPDSLRCKFIELEGLFPNSFPRVNDISVKVCTPVPAFSISARERMGFYKLSFSNAVIVPYKWKFAGTTDLPECTDPEILEIAQKRAEKLTNTLNAMQTFKAEVSKTWESAPSVNAFVKLWPAGRDLLPVNVLEKIDEKTTRVKVSAIEVDVTKLNTELLKAKLIA